MAENKNQIDTLANGCPSVIDVDVDEVIELPNAANVVKTNVDSNTLIIDNKEEISREIKESIKDKDAAVKIIVDEDIVINKNEEKSKSLKNLNTETKVKLNDGDEKEDILKDVDNGTTKRDNNSANISDLDNKRDKIREKNIEDDKPKTDDITPSSVLNEGSKSTVVKLTVSDSSKVVEKSTEEVPKRDDKSVNEEITIHDKKGIKNDEEEGLREKISEDKKKKKPIDEVDNNISRDNLTSAGDINEAATTRTTTTTNNCQNDDNNEDHRNVEDENEADDELEMETEDVEDEEDDDDDDDDDVDDEDDDDEDENENEQLEVGIVGPPTAVSELINEEELRCSESVLLTESDRRTGVDNVQDHVAEWVQNSANNKPEELTIDEDDNDNDIQPSDDRRLSKNQKNSTENIEKNVEVLTTRKSKRVVNNIIKRSIKCLNKMHAMDASSGMIKASEKGATATNTTTASSTTATTTGPSTKKVEKVLERVENTKSRDRREAIESSGGTAAATATTASSRSQNQNQNQNRDRRNQNNHHQINSNHSRNGGGDNRRGQEEEEEEEGEGGGGADDEDHFGVKKEPNSEPETDPEPERDSLPELRKRSGSDRNNKNIKIERESKKRRSTDEIQNTNGKSKRACLEQREEFISSLVGGEKVTTEELTVRAEQLRAELQALDQLARAKEKEWNEILSMRKLKEEAYLRIERRRQVVGFMEGNGQLNETSVIPSVSLSLEPEWDNAKEKSNSTEATLSDKSITRPQVTSKQSENGQKESSDGQNSETRQIGEGRQGPMVDVRTIIADYRLRHPETVPRRSRRMRNSVNVGLGAGGAMVENTHVGADSRPSSTDSCKSSSNVTDPNNSMSFKDVLVQFAKLSQQQGEAVKTPQNYPDVTLHPVLPSPAAAPQTAAIQQTGSLLHGILTKSQSPRPTTFSPTLARLLTAPERDRCNPIATSTPQQSSATQHLLQAYQGTNPVSISDLLSSSKARTEITITPVVNPAPQSHSNSLIHVEDVEEETTVIEERGGRSSNARDDSPPRCQGCQERAAQFVCAGCGNQWYCSRECQVSAWDEHSEVCSG